ncbi:aminotransferase class III-fold pyridoxal phosphate-dependent enzyme [Candidatus Pelagibacter sp.]|nr:aminotransferase class III-fold pyridoxal phosphate-dependent enzyme [Candidatus Pelagibacter sp.]
MNLYPLKNKILHGNSLLSKNPKSFINNGWPNYFQKAKGIYVYDLKNKKYLDMVFAVGTNLLGYSNINIDKKILQAVKLGTMSTLNCLEEVILSKEILKLNKWAGMVKYARSGGEANCIAIRIARCYSKKTNIAVCGYHGWHDWYLSANISESKNELKNIFLPGVKVKGIPKQLKGTTYVFKYNDYENLKKIVEKKNIGIIKMEVMRNQYPKDNFLQKVRKLCDKNNIVLIFDECTSGFRDIYGGIHKKFKIKPDIAMFSKAIGNGYPISIVVGKKKIMKSAENSFISSTYWSERLGYVAALATLKEMKRIKSWNRTSLMGKFIKKKWKEISKKHSIDIIINEGIDSIPSFDFKYNKEFLKKFLIKEMLKKNILASNYIFVSTQHNINNTKKYFKVFDLVLKKIKEKSFSKKNKKIYSNQMVRFN